MVVKFVVNVKLNLMINFFRNVVKVFGFIYFIIFNRLKNKMKELVRIYKMVVLKLDRFVVVYFVFDGGIVRMI